ncbi:MAG TPA: cyclic nucleotide-binding and patatin-like phospholipase domain-containing protein [Casimicrobiaceae bacterium]|nr:cyclic nucleotide-binding and patatin-like phospholipase domain-containing protein [Casimicrobiaceae bacterium]
MERSPLSAEHRALLVARHLQPPFPPAAAVEVLGVLRAAHLPPGATLMRQGDAGDDMFLVLTGRVAVQVVTAADEPTVVDEIEPGGVVGEMALLTGQPRTATVVALTPVDVACLARRDFEALAAHHPEALNLFLHRVLPRLRRTQLVGVLTELFGALGAQAQKNLEQHLEWREIAGGETLFRQGDPGDDVYIVVNGRLRVSVDDDGPVPGRRVLEEVGRGQAVGEVSLLTGEARAATVTAVRDSDLLRLSRASFDELLDRHPRPMMTIARAAAKRLRDASLRTQRPPGPTSFALIAGGDPRLLAPLAAQLAAQLGALAGDPARVVLLDSAAVDRRLARPGIAQSGPGSIVHESLVAWMAALEREHAFTVLCADAGDTEWTRRCLRAADRVLVVAAATDPPAPAAAEAYARARHPSAHYELVLIHPAATTQPSGTLAWLEARDVVAHHHVRVGHAGDVGRLARRVAGRACALVLGGGGARGFAHLGALRALDEAGIPVDMIGGTSIGAVIAGARALGLTVTDLTALARAFASRRKILDRTLPIVALTEGAKVTALYRQVFGDARIEDLWIPHFAVSSGLSRAEAVLHTRGELWWASRASTAVPAIFPPIVAPDNEVLVDGNVMNNMPLDVMRARCEGGTLIGVNPMPAMLKPRPYNSGASVSGWTALAGRMKLFGVRLRAPNLVGSVMRATEINSANRMRSPAFRALADLLIEPAVGGYAIHGYSAWEPIVEIGYKAAKEALAAWPLAPTLRATGQGRVPAEEERAGDAAMLPPLAALGPGAGG